MLTHTHRTLWLRLLLIPLVSAVLIALPLSSAIADQECHGAMIRDTDLCLLECVPNVGGSAPICWISAAQTAGMGAFLIYVNQGIWGWAFGVGIGIAILNGVIGAFQITASNGNQASVDAGKARILWSIGGLLLLMLAGTILNFFNPVGFLPG